MLHSGSLYVLLVLLLSAYLSSAANDWSVTPAARDGSATANSQVHVIPNIIRQQTGYLTITNNSCDHFAVVAAGSPSHPCGGITVSQFARQHRCCCPFALLVRIFSPLFFRAHDSPSDCLHFRCVAAVNGGIFGFSKGWKTPLDERCSLGVIVCNGSAWSADPNPQPVFAMSSTCDIYVGNFPYSLFASAAITNAVSGQEVIVINGTAQPCSYPPSPAPGSAHPRRCHTKAPRTALGHDARGRIMTLQVDGDESDKTGTSNLFSNQHFICVACASSDSRDL